MHRGVLTLTGDRGPERAPPSGSAHRQRRGPRPQPVLLVHRTQDNVEGHERHENGAVRRHARQEQEEPQGSEVAWVAAEAERTSPHHFVVGADRRSLRLRCGTNIISRKQVPDRR